MEHVRMSKVTEWTIFSDGNVGLFQDARMMRVWAIEGAPSPFWFGMTWRRCEMTRHVIPRPTCGEPGRTKPEESPNVVTIRHIEPAGKPRHCLRYQ